MSGISGSGTDIYARARLQFAIAPTGANILVNASLPSGFISLTDKLCFVFKATSTNTNVMKLDIGDGVQRALVNVDGSAMNAGDVQNGMLIEAFYDLATNRFVCQPDAMHLGVMNPANGYVKLPGGLILQWGSLATPGQNLSAAVVFPTPFPTAIASITFGAQGTNYNGGDINKASAITVNGFTCSQYNTTGGNNAAIYWMAIGY